MQTVLIMEGPDGCGKTNIGKELARRLCIPYFKADSEKRHWKEGKFKEALEFDQDYIVQFLEQTGYPCIIDRAWPSEYVYSTVFKRETNTDAWDEIDHKFSELGTIVILCLRRSYRNCADDLVPSDKLQNIHDVYLEFVKDTHCHVVKIYVDDFNESLEEQIPLICGAIETLVNVADRPITITLEG